MADLVSDVLTRRIDPSSAATASPAAGFLSGFIPARIARMEQQRVESVQKAEKDQEREDAIRKEQEQRKMILSQSGADIINRLMANMQGPDGTPMTQFTPGTYDKAEISAAINAGHQASTERMNANTNATRQSVAAQKSQTTKTNQMAQYRITQQIQQLEDKKSKIMERIMLGELKDNQGRVLLTSIVNQINHMRSLEHKYYPGTADEAPEFQDAAPAVASAAPTDMSDDELKALFSN